MEASRKEDLEGKLQAAQEEIGRLKGDKQAAALSPAASAAAAVSGGSSVQHLSPIMGGGGGSEEEEKDEGFSSGRDNSTEGSPLDEQEASLVSMLDDVGGGSSSSYDVSDNGSPAGGQHQETAVVGATSPSLSGSTSADNDGRSDGVHDEAEEPRAFDNHEPSPLPSPKVLAKKRGRRKLVGQVEESQAKVIPDGGGARQRKKKQQIDRQPLGNLQNGATPARSKSAKTKTKIGKNKVGVDAHQEEAAAAAVVVEEEEEQEQNEYKTSRTRGRGKRTRAKKAEKANETQRCKEMRYVVFNLR